MAEYKVAFVMHQDAYGSEHAKARFSIDGDVLADNVEVSNTDSSNPTVLPYVWTSSKEPADDHSVTATVKIEFLNDEFVDTSNDRNLCFHMFGYAYKQSSGRYVKMTGTPGDTEVTHLTDSSDWTDFDNYNTTFRFAHTGSLNEEVHSDDAGTHETHAYPMGKTITTSFIEFTVTLNTKRIELQNHLNYSW